MAIYHRKRPARRRESLLSRMEITIRRLIILFVLLCLLSLLVLEITLPDVVL